MRPTLGVAIFTCAVERRGVFCHAWKKLCTGYNCLETLQNLVKKPPSILAKTFFRDTPNFGQKQFWKKIAHRVISRNSAQDVTIPSDATASADVNSECGNDKWFYKLEGPQWCSVSELHYTRDCWLRVDQLQKGLLQLCRSKIYLNRKIQLTIALNLRPSSDLIIATNAIVITRNETKEVQQVNGRIHFQ